MSLPQSANPLRRSSFPPSSPPLAKQPKRLSDPPPSLLSIRSLEERQRKEKQHEKQLQSSFAKLKDRPGRKYSLEENRLLLTILHGVVLNEGVDAPKACRMLATFSGAHHSTLSALLSAWNESNVVPSPDTSKRGKGNPSHPLHLHEFSLEVEQAIHRTIQEHNQRKGFVNTADIQSMLMTDFGIEKKRNGLSRRLHALGYLWGRARTMGGMTYAARVARGVTYMKELSLALEEEKLGNALIAFTDESYVNVRHKIEYTWFSPYTPWKNEVGGPGRHLQDSAPWI